MAVSRPYPDRPPELDVGDRVVAVQPLGGFLRATVRRGTRGVVIARPQPDVLRVRFATGRTLDVHPSDVSLPDPTGDDLDPG